MSDPNGAAATVDSQVGLIRPTWEPAVAAAPFGSDMLIPDPGPAKMQHRGYILASQADVAEAAAAAATVDSTAPLLVAKPQSRVSVQINFPPTIPSSPSAPNQLEHVEGYSGSLLDGIRGAGSN